MAKRTITLRYAGTCRDCGSELPVGSRARWYGRGRVYGLDCHEPTGATKAALNSGNREGRLRRAIASDAPAGLIASIADPRGAYSADGTFLGSTGPRCEDAPCCGCC